MGADTGGGRISVRTSARRSMSYEVSTQTLRDNMATIERKNGESNELNDEVIHHLNDAPLHLACLVGELPEIRGLRGALSPH